ncbi:MAG: OmpA/MotB family protein [Bacteriovoracaceae bacterium]
MNYDDESEQDDNEDIIAPPQLPVVQSRMKPSKSSLDVSGGSDSSDDSIWLTSYADLMTLVACFFILLVAFANFDPQSFSRKANEMAKHFSGDKPENDTELIEKLKEEIESDPVLKSNVEVKMEMDGVVINFSGSALFESGSADVKREVQDALDIMIDLILEKNKDSKIVIEGHTDSLPLGNSSIFKNNWELSGARAARVVDRFEKFGFKSDHLVAVGYGSTRPLKPNYDDSGLPNLENMKENRRIMIKVFDNPSMLKREKLGLGIYLDDKILDPPGAKDAEISVDGEKISP